MERYACCTDGREEDFDSCLSFWPGREITPEDFKCACKRMSASGRVLCNNLNLYFPHLEQDPFASCDIYVFLKQLAEESLRHQTNPTLFDLSTNSS